MHKLSLFTLVLTLVTASLLASCGSSGGSGDSYPANPNLPTNSNPVANSSGSTNASSTGSSTAGKDKQAPVESDFAPTADLANSLAQINTVYQQTYANLSLNNFYALGFNPYYLSYIDNLVERGILPYYHNNNYLLYALGASSSLTYQDNGVVPLNPLVATTIPTNFNMATYQPSSQPYSSSPNLYIPKVLVVDNNFDPGLVSSHNFNAAKVIELTGLNPKFKWQGHFSADNHGFYVGSLISGKATTVDVHSEPSTQPEQVKVSGLVPYSQISFVGLNLDATDPELNSQQMASLDQIYQYAFAQTKPDVINNSFGLSLVDPLNEAQASRINQNYDIMARGILQVTSNPQTAPLFVYAAGNYNSGTLLGKLSEDYNQHSNINFLNQVLANPNYGVGLTDQSALGKLVANPKVNPYLIVVSGFVYDNAYSKKNLNFNTANKLRLMSNFINTHYLNTPEQSESAYLSSLDHPTDPTKTAQAGNDRFNRHTYEFKDRLLSPEAQPIANKGHIYSALGAYQCGATAYDCIAAPYIYQQPYFNNDQPYGQLKGTSFAAPYVTSAALLVKQKYPWMTAANLKTTILTTATDIGALGVDPVFGWGALNIGRALQGPAQFAFGEFKVDFGNNTVNPSKGVSTDQIINLFTTNPYLNTSYLNTVSQNFSFYDFNAVTGVGGLSLDNSKAQLNSGLRIFIAGYQGATKVKNSVLVLENPLSVPGQVQFDLLNTRTFFKQAGLPTIVYVNNDRANHPIAYSHRIDVEKSLAATGGFNQADDTDPSHTKGYYHGFSNSADGGSYNFNDDNSYPLVPASQTPPSTSSNQQASHTGTKASSDPYTFTSAITIGEQGVVVSNLPQVASVTNQAGIFFPYSFLTFGQYGGYYHDAPYQGSVIKHFTQESLGTSVFGVSLNEESPALAQSDLPSLASKTVVNAQTQQAVYSSYSSNGKLDDHNVEGHDSDYQAGHEPYTRRGQVVSTAIFSDQAQVAGKALVYFNYGAKLSNGDAARLQTTVNASSPIRISSTNIFYIPTSGLQVSLVNAKALTGNFSQVGFVNPDLTQAYSLSPAQLVHNFAGLTDYNQSLVVTITPKATTERVAASSGTSVLDTTLVRSAAKTVDTIYKLADQQYFGVNHNQAPDHQNYLALASAAQSSDNQNFRTFLYQNALTVYPDLQLATTQNSHSQVNNFIDRVANNYLHNVSHQVYFDYNYKQTNWTSPTSAIFGSDKIHNLSLGYYGQSYGLNYGLAGLVNYGTWNEDLTSLNADLAHLQLANLTNLASAKTITAGLVATIGKAQARSFYAINLSANFHNYDLTRNLLFLTETTKFNALDFELAGRYGYSLYHTDHSRFSVIGGLSLVDNYRLAVKETASINPTKLEQVTGNTDTQAVAAQFKYTSLDAKAHNALNMYASVALAYTYNFKVLNFNQALSVQGKAERVLNDLNFNINSNTNGSSLASTSVFNNNYIITAKATYQVNFTTNLKLDLYAAYTFCQNWQDKTAGTSLTYSF